MDAARKLVSDRLKAQVAGPHPDPEVLAALAEGSTSEAVRSSVLNHLSACTDCRDMLYLALPEPAEKQHIVPAPRRHPRFGVRWATLAASIVILGGVLLTNRQLFNRGSQTSVDVAVNESIPTQTVPANPAPPLEKSEARQSPSQALSKSRPAEKHMTARPQADMQFDNSDQVHFAARSANQAPPLAHRKPEQPVSVETEAKQVDASRTNSIAAIPMLWRVSEDGAPRRSLDGGHTWQAVLIDDGVSVRAINSAGRNVWAGGNSGALYHSVDGGENWTKVEPVSAGKKLASDITEIHFTNPANGVVNTANGEVWSTSDSGKNWQLK
jgi:photosynthesis system II assembly factor YCF48-like protein